MIHVGRRAFIVGTIVFVSVIIALFLNKAGRHGERLGNDGVVLQSQWNNCGPSALKMIFDHYGIPSSVEEIERSVGMTDAGSSMLALKEAAISKGLKTEGWKLSFNALSERPLPALMYVMNDHFVVADSIVGETVYYRDPATGRIRMTKDDFSKIWRGETLVFSHK